VEAPGVRLRKRRQEEELGRDAKNTVAPDRIRSGRDRACAGAGVDRIPVFGISSQ
jgi:hypothetical protein